MAGIAALALAYVLSQFYRSFLAVLTPALSLELGASKADLSLASGAWFITFALMQFVVGVWLDRFGPRQTASFLLAGGGGGGALVFALASEPWMITLAMALIGIGCAPILMAAVYIFARTQPPARFAIMTSWMVGVGSAGNVIGSSPLAGLAEGFGWRAVMLALGVTTVLVALAIYFTLADEDRQEHRSAGPAGFLGFAALLRLKVLWPIIPLTALNYAPSAGIRGLWAGPYLADVHGADALIIGQVTIFMAFGMVAGSFIYGPLDRLLGTRKWIVVGGNAASLVSLSFLAFVPGKDLFAVTVCLVALGISGASYGMVLAHARSFLPPDLIGRGMTLMNFFSIGGVGMIQFATGSVVSGWMDPQNPALAYSALFSFYLVLLAVAIGIYLASRDAKP